MRVASTHMAPPPRSQQRHPSLNTDHKQRAHQTTASIVSIGRVEGAFASGNIDRNLANDNASCASGKRKRSAADGAADRLTYGGQRTQLRVDSESAAGFAVIGERDVHEHEAARRERRQDHEKNRNPALSKPLRAGDPIQLAVDEKLMAMVVAYETKFADPCEPINSLWEAIGLALGGDSGYAVQPRVHFLRDVWKNPSHTMHASLSEKLRILVQRYVDARKQREDSILNAIRRKSLTPNLDPEMEPPADVVDVVMAQSGNEDNTLTEQRLPWLDKCRVHSSIDSAIEEEVARIVLNHSPRFPDARSIVSVWQAIADDSRGRYNSRLTAQRRTLYLCEVASTPSHPRHRQLTPSLREMLLRVLADWNNVGVEKSAEAGGSKSTTKMAVDSANDEVLMELVLEKRAIAHSEPAIWAEIVEASKHPRVHDCMSGTRRVLFLSRVFEKPKHDQHSHLSPRLRFLLTKYALAAAKSRSSQRNDGDHATPTTPNSKPQQVRKRSRQAASPEVSSATRGNNSPQREDAVDEIALPDRSNSHTLRPEFTPQAQSKKISSVNMSPSVQENGQQHEFVIASLSRKVATLEKVQIEMRGELRKAQVAVNKLQEELRVQQATPHQETKAMMQLLEKERQERKDELKAVRGLLSRTGATNSLGRLPTSSSHVGVNESCFI